MMSKFGLAKICKPGQVYMPVMKTGTESTPDLSDPAAVFASALSLWQECQKHASADKKINFSESYNGVDQFMREVMRVANLFETWACAHINFDQTNDVWPYLLEDKFGEACLAVILPTTLAQVEDDDCLRVAIRLQLLITLDDGLRLPIDVVAQNPLGGSGFQKYRIQTIRDSVEDGTCVPFTAADEAFDDNFGAPYFGLYGMSDDGLLEHIADRRTYAEALRLAQKIAPGVEFPETPIFSIPV